MNFGVAFVAGLVLGLRLARQEHIENKTLIDSYYKVTTTLKRENAIQFELGRDTGKMEAIREIFALVETNK